MFLFSSILLDIARQLVAKALDHLKDGLGLFVQREFENLYGDEAISKAGPYMQLGPHPDDLKQWAAAALLTLMWNAWRSVFRDTLGHAERSLVSELWDVRNKWAHQERFEDGDASRALDSVERLLKAVGAPQEAGMKRERIELQRAEVKRWDNGLGQQTR